ncbi:alpha/beta fold hydrolase [Demequina flava]|uniref:alpha/beta fold hydrolase n=1 Tax=Demequina flava TaxID=1095025 RepID=UPI000782D686|nr:alpha/beta hydrolase [Demequina flava]
MRSKRDDARYRAAEAELWASEGLEPQEHWVTVPESGIRVRAMVSGEGPSVLFIHGTPTAGGVYVPLVAVVPGYRSIVLDRPGCALSEPLDTSTLTPTGASGQIAAAMAAVADQLGDGPVHVVGNSAGGMAAIALAQHRPDLVRSLTLEGVPAVQGMTLPRAMRVATFKPVAAIVARWPVTERDFERSFKTMGHTELLARGGLSPEQQAWRVALARYTDTYTHDLAALGLGADWRGLRPGWAPGPETLRDLPMPSLWIVGDQDPFATPDAVREWAQEAPQSTVVVRDREGHQPWLDNPEGHSALLRDFWARADRAATA